MDVPTPNNVTGDGFGSQPPTLITHQADDHNNGATNQLDDTRAQNTNGVSSPEEIKGVVKLPSSPVLENEEDRVQRRRMRWWFCWVGLSLSIFLFLAALAGTIIAFCLTKSPVSLSIFTAAVPPAYFIKWFMGRIAEYVFPMDERTFLLKKHQTEAKARSIPLLKRIIG